MSNSDKLTLPPVIGHRGAMAYAPENTEASFRQAKARGCAWVEFDVRLTRDGVPVLIHDAALNRTTDGTGRVAARDYASLAERDAGGWFAPEFAGERILTLARAVALLGELGLGANIELKPTRRHQAALVNAVTAVLRARWPDTLPPPLLSSFDRKILAALAALDVPWPRGYLAKALPRRWRWQASRLGCASIHCAHQHLKKPQARAVKAAGFVLAAYTVNDPARMATLFDWGVDAVFADAPDRLIAAL
ncbi:MAG TPA: glycerophosphoryl diester phosphodiesterase [Alphaproteobacteria bacterium]|nr:glycerophosphoryl diester phosphodiesterase [Alphaproteobacteria bacterium]